MSATSVHFGSDPVASLDIHGVPWNQSRKTYGAILDALQAHNETAIRQESQGCKRSLARLNACSGPVSGRWLTSFPLSWWREFPDDVFIMSLRFRLGVPVVPAGLRCYHAQCKDQDTFCDEPLDEMGDHAVACNIGAYVSCRHSALNHTLAQAGRDAGYAVLFEQVVPELALRRQRRDATRYIEDARIDVELFGHPCAPPWLLDGTVRHPAAQSILSKASRIAGAAAQVGVDAKHKRYPPRGGKSVLACSVETWGYIHENLDNFLGDLAVLASQRQRNMGQHPTRWLSKWRTEISIQIAMSVGKSLVAAVPPHTRPICIRERVERSG